MMAVILAVYVFPQIPQNTSLYSDAMRYGLP